MNRLILNTTTLAAGVAMLGAGSVAQAHVGHEAFSFSAGLTHPWLGVDHLLAAFAVGMVAARSGRRGVWMPAVFMLSMLAGAAAALSPAVAEWGIIASLLALAGVLIARVRPSAKMLAPLIAIAGLCHGTAHFSEAATTGDFASGLLMGTLALHAAGIGFVQLLASARRDQACRWAGVAMGVVAMMLTVG